MFISDIFDHAGILLYRKDHVIITMVVVKISRKRDLDDLVSKITLRLGKKPTQQEIIDACIEFGMEHFDELVTKLVPIPIIDDEKLRKIREASESLSDTPWEPLKKGRLASRDDFDIYST
jgi:hypothetical protein